MKYDLEENHHQSWDPKFMATISPIFEGSWRQISVNLFLAQICECPVEALEDDVLFQIYFVMSSMIRPTYEKINQYIYQSIKLSYGFVEKWSLDKMQHSSYGAFYIHISFVSTISLRGRKEFPSWSGDWKFKVDGQHGWFSEINGFFKITATNSDRYYQIYHQRRLLIKWQWIWEHSHMDFRLV